MRMPVILGASVTIVIGVISRIFNVSNQEIYYRMAISLVVFYLLGLYAENTIKKIEEEVRRKKEEEEIKAQKEQQEQQKEQEKQAQGVQRHTIDLKAGDDAGDDKEDFLPLEMSKAVRTIALEDDAG